MNLRATGSPPAEDVLGHLLATVPDDTIISFVGSGEYHLALVSYVAAYLH